MRQSAKTCTKIANAWILAVNLTKCFANRVEIILLMIEYAHLFCIGFVSEKIRSFFNV